MQKMCNNILRPKHFYMSCPQVILVNNYQLPVSCKRNQPPLTTMHHSRLKNQRHKHRTGNNYTALDREHISATVSLLPSSRRANHNLNLPKCNELFRGPLSTDFLNFSKNPRVTFSVIPQTNGQIDRQMAVKTVNPLEVAEELMFPHHNNTRNRSHTNESMDDNLSVAEEIKTVIPITV